MADVADRLDLARLVGSLDQDEAPRSLAEIQAEVGFPFVAKAVTTPALPAAPTLIPEGESIRILGASLSQKPEFFSAIYSDELVNAYNQARRWILLGHST